MTYKLTLRAQKDLTKISDYTQNKYGVAQEKAYMDAMELKLAYVGNNPAGVGAPCDHIRPGLKSYPASRHMIYFRPAASGGANIIAVLGATQDPARHL